ncbi:MAG: WXG100 family type VII secretion target [Propionibacteriaceae bacterium]|nr:WXG100 family type VII secretion target [Propionibacteriaceae bacterium]
MNIETVRRIGRALRSESSKLRGVMQEIDRLVGSTGGSWKGPDHDQFAKEWNGVMRARVAQIAQQLLDLSEKARTNADAQDQTSTEFDGGAGFGSADGGPWKWELTDKVSQTWERHSWKWDWKYTKGAELPDPDDPGKKPGDGEADGSGKKPGDSDSDGSGKKRKTEFKIAEVSTGDNVWNWDRTWGDENANATVKADALFYDAKAGVSAKDWQFSGAAGVEAGLVRAGVDGQAEWGVLEAKGKGEAYVGGKADVELGVGKSGINAEAEAFAGARASVSGSADVAGVGVTGGAEGWAGIGASAKAQFGKVDGKYGFKLELGAAIGIGGKVSIGFQVDVPKLVNSVKDGARAVGDFVSNLWPF